MEKTISSRERVRVLRQTATPAERVLWELLRDRKLLGMKFRRQCPIDRYIADFCCKEPRIVVELDGEIHEGPIQVDHDQNRDLYLRARGYRVLRFPNHKVFEDPVSILDEIARLARALRPGLPR